MIRFNFLYLFYNKGVKGKMDKKIFYKYYMVNLDCFFILMEN